MPISPGVPTAPHSLPTVRAFPQIKNPSDPGNIAPATAALAATEASDTLSAAATVLVGGALTATEGSDTLSAAGGPIVGGALAATEAADTLAAAGGPTVGGALSATEGADAVSAAATVLVGAALAESEADDTLSAIAALLVAGNAIIVEADDALSSAGDVEPISGAANINEANDILFGLANNGIVPQSDWLMRARRHGLR